MSARQRGVSNRAEPGGAWRPRRGVPKWERGEGADPGIRMRTQSRATDKADILGGNNAANFGPWTTRLGWNSYCMKSAGDFGGFVESPV